MEGVHAREGGGALDAEMVSHGGSLDHEGFLPRVDRAIQPALAQPVGIFLPIAVGINAGHHVEPIPACLRPLAGRVLVDQERHHPPDVLPLFFLVAGGEGLRPRELVAVVAFVVAPRADEGFSEAVAEVLGIRLVGNFHEGPGQPLVEVVDRRGTADPGHMILVERINPPFASGRGPLEGRAPADHLQARRVDLRRPVRLVEGFAPRRAARLADHGGFPP